MSNNYSLLLRDIASVFISWGQQNSHQGATKGGVGNYGRRDTQAPSAIQLFLRCARRFTQGFAQVVGY